MIIVEGPDGSGKTRLIEELVHLFDMEVAPRVVSKEAKAMVDLVEWTSDNLARGFHWQIYDRHRLISEPIYGAILREEFEPGFDDPNWLHEMMFQMYTMVRPIIIYCVPPFETVDKNIRGDQDNLVVKDHIRKIWSLYLSKAVTDVAMYDRALFYDYTKPHTFSRVMLGVKRILDEAGYYAAV